MKPALGFVEKALCVGNAFARQEKQLINNELQYCWLANENKDR
ncbi:MAG: hypothetical protein ABIU77_14015 [Ferruginibacter sp.]